MANSKVHWCPMGFTTICGANPRELRIAMSQETITCNNCRRICGLTKLEAAFADADRREANDEKA